MNISRLNIHTEDSSCFPISPGLIGGTAQQVLQTHFLSSENMNAATIITMLIKIGTFSLENKNYRPTKTTCICITAWKPVQQDLELTEASRVAISRLVSSNNSDIRRLPMTP